MERDVCGIRIKPSTLNFKDIEAQKVFSLQISAKNISRESKQIRFYPPQSKDFKLRVKQHEKVVACGLDHSAFIEFKTDKCVPFEDRVVVTVDGEVINVPVIVRPCEPVLEMAQEMNFGPMVMANRVVTRDLKLKNSGSRPGQFKIEYSGSKPLNIVPSSGQISPKTTQILRVEYVTKEVHEFDENVVVKLEGQEPFQLRVLGRIVYRSLELHSPNEEGKQLPCIKFPATYYATDSMKTAVLYNNCPEPVNFVTILEEDAIGQESGCPADAPLPVADPKECTNPFTSLMAMIPNQGIIGPYQKIPVFFKFSPRWKAPRQAFKESLEIPPRQKFALFMHIQMVGGGESNEEAQPSGGGGSQLEIAVTGLALPVNLQILPHRETDFGVCPSGEFIEKDFQLTNNSGHLAVNFQFRRVAHFIAKPDKGSIKPGETLNVVVRFHPRQYGEFSVIQPIDVIGRTGDDRNPFIDYEDVIYSETLFFRGICNSEMKPLLSKFNAGITPLITNENGICFDPKFDSFEKKPAMALITEGCAASGGVNGSKIFAHREALSGDYIGDAFIALPNDRAGSIRPAEKGKQYRTVLNRSKRYHYTDPDYAYFDSEGYSIKARKMVYDNSIREMSKQRQVLFRDKKLAPYENDLDMGMVPGCGVMVKPLTEDDIRPTTPPPTPPNQQYKMLSTKEVQESKKKVRKRKKTDGFNAIPTSEEEKQDCRLQLTPQQLHQIVVGPSTIDFGRVCLRSQVIKELQVVNNLNQYIHFVVEIDCRELRQSSPLSQVVPPKTKIFIPMIFESSVKGKFQRNVNYSINGYHDHVIALGEVVAVDLSLSTDLLEVSPTLGQPADSGIRGVISLYNQLNLAAEFNWEPIFKANGTAFSIRPKTGIVDAFSQLDCEVVFHPSFNAPEEGEFILNVVGGEERRLQCRAHLGGPFVSFMNRRILFGQVPLYLTTVRTAVLQNLSQNHAYFRVLDTNPYPGLTISPVSGVVPVGGQAKLKATMAPNSISKFDCCVRVAIRGWKELELRMGGHVILPSVEIVQKSFVFGGVYIGSSSRLEFDLVNRTATRTKLEFDLSRYRDFRLCFPGKDTPEDYSHALLNPGIFTVTIQGEETINCFLEFTPTEVASYDFILPVIINNIKAPTPSPTPIPATPFLIPKEGAFIKDPNLPDCRSDKKSKRNSNESNDSEYTSNVMPKTSITPEVYTPRRRVTATARRQPLHLSNKHLEFCLRPEDDNQTPESAPQTLQIVNHSTESLSWSLSFKGLSKQLRCFRFFDKEGARLQEDDQRRINGDLPSADESVSLEIVFVPINPGTVRVTVPVYINNDFTRPYDHLTLFGELKWPQIAFEPGALSLTPIPLNTEVTVRFNVLAINYRKKAKLRIDYPHMEAEDGTPLRPINISFVDQPEFVPPKSTQTDLLDHTVVLKCRLSFKSSRPISFCSPINFVDDFGNSAQLIVSCTADNSVLTCYPFISKHRDDYHIVCEEGKVLEGLSSSVCNVSDLGEAQMVPLGVGDVPHSQTSTTATSSNFEISTNTYEDSISETESPLPSTPRDGALNKLGSKQPTLANLMVNSRSQLQGRRYSQRSGLKQESGLSGSDDSDTQSSTDSWQETQLGVYHLELEGFYYQDVLSAVQRWFTINGWTGGPFPILVPETLRCSLTRKASGDEEERKAKSKSGAGWDSSGAKVEQKTLYDMITYLCGRPSPGIPTSSSMPSESYERVKQIYWQHQTMLTFLKSQGGCLSSVRPEHLMEPKDYRTWLALDCPGAEGKPTTRINVGGGEKDLNETLTRHKSLEDAALESSVFEGISKRAWTDVLLQIMKTLVLYKVNMRSYKNLVQPDPSLPLPSINVDPLASNCYTLNERILLAWLNHFYAHYREKIWANAKDGAPSARWVINFDYDLLDGLVLAAALGAHMPFLIETHLRDMYTNPKTPEQCLHNALKVVNALRFVGHEFDIQALDITDPHPVMMLMLVCSLYQSLYQYIPKANIEFVGSLHSVSTRQAHICNPSGKTLVYRVQLAGRDARDFCLPKGDTLSIAGKASVSIPIEFKSRFIRPAEAVVMVMGRRTGPAVGCTTLFTMTSHVNAVNPVNTEKVTSPCYAMRTIPLNVLNPFNESGSFRVVVIESDSDLLQSINDAFSRPTKVAQPPKSKATVPKQHSEENEEKVAPMPRIKHVTKKNEAPVDSSSGLLSFFCHTNSVYLEANSSSIVEINFLPFQIGRKQCSVVLVNDNIGEFLHAVEAIAELPLPTPVPYSEELDNRGARISTAVAASRGQKGDTNVVYWRCELNKRITDVLRVPVSNRQKERALLLAAQEHLSEKEVARRRITGTLYSSSLVSKAIEMLSIKKTGPKKVSPEKKYERKSNIIVFRLEGDNSSFKLPETVKIPDPSKPMASVAEDSTSTEAAAPASPIQTIEIPITFQARSSGLYTLNLILKGPDDVRVHRIECMVVPEGSSAEITFSSPVHQQVVQKIPLVNETSFDWPLTARLQGPGFKGQEGLLAKAYSTTNFLLRYKPMSEGESTGKLSLTNKTDGTEHVFHLKGIGTKPLALDNLVFTSLVNESAVRTILVPNATHRKIVFDVESSLSFITGKETATVLPGRQVEYQMIVAPKRRGHFTGVIAFVAGKEKIIEYDSDGDEIPPMDPNAGEEGTYRVWYSLDVTVSKAPPLSSLTLSGSCQTATILAVPVTNPLTDRSIHMEAEIEGENLSGPATFSLGPGQTLDYELVFTPAVVGESRGSLILYCEEVGEFWFDLTLHAECPPVTTMPPVSCQLGKWQLVEIELNNPSPFDLELNPVVSNQNNYAIQLPHEDVLLLEAHTSMIVPVRFTPSDIGEANHNCVINFACDRLGEWIFHLSGIGELPRPHDTVCVTSEAGSNATILIPFHNPLDVPVFVDLYLSDASQRAIQCKLLDTEVPDQESVFRLLLKHERKVRLGRKTAMDIPVSFAPSEMREYNAVVTVVMRRKDGLGWSELPNHDPLDITIPPPLEDGELKEIRWLYPIKGIPELKVAEARTTACADSDQVTKAQIPLVQGPARASIEERLELWLASVAPPLMPPQGSPIRLRNKTPALGESTEGDLSNADHKNSLVLNYIGSEEGQFTWEVVPVPDQGQAAALLSDALQMMLVRQMRDECSGMMSLLFNLSFRPLRSFRCEAEILIRSSVGGLWRYPIKFLATEPEIDDVITMHAAGLNKPTTIQIKLNSQDNIDMPFQAFFDQGSDPDFSVTPQSGVLPQSNIPGLPLYITFRPVYYGKPKEGKLVVQTEDMEWSYHLIGEIPDYNPPRGLSLHPIAGPHPDMRVPRRMKNHIRENMRLQITANCSPVKGATILPRL